MEFTLEIIWSLSYVNQCFLSGKEQKQYLSYKKEKDTHINKRPTI